jgi:phosphomannomutase
MGAFKSYDIRGIWEKDFDATTVYKIGRCLPTLLSADRVLIGRDARSSSPVIFDALMRGITEAGADVDSMGLTTTPMTYYFTGKKGYACAVMITASHNPKEYNGLKISRKGALPVGSDSGLKTLEAMIAGELPPVAAVPGKINEVNFHDEYIEFYREQLPCFDGLKVAVDCSNGMSSLFVRPLFGNAVDCIYEEIDGTFPNHAPNPLEPEATLALREKVKQGGYDIGVIFDGDADRVMFVDNHGEFVRPDIITGILAEYYLGKEPGKPVLCDIRTSRGVTEYVAKLGGVPHLWKVGHAFAKVKLRELGAIVGGELAGHYYFRDFFCCDSAFLCAMLVLGVAAKVKQEGRSFSDLLKAIDPYANTGECNYTIEEKDAAIDAVIEAAKQEFGVPSTFLDFDGVRCEWPTWWFNIRKSNTEPYLRLVAEAQTENELAERKAFIENVLKNFIRKGN